MTSEEAIFLTIFQVIGVICALSLVALLIYKLRPDLFSQFNNNSLEVMCQHVKDAVQEAHPEGLLVSTWFDYNTKMIGLNIEQSSIIIACANWTQTEKPCILVHINVRDIVSSEVLCDETQPIFVGLPVSVGNASVFVGGNLGNSQPSNICIKITLNDMQNPLLVIPMPDIVTAEEWHARLQVLAAKAA